jgi:hypothetical protein
MRKYLSILTRCRDEFFIKEWCDYYLSQGIEEIHIVDDDSEDKSIYDFADTPAYKNVNIIFSERLFGHLDTHTHFDQQKKGDKINTIYTSLRHRYKWLIYCDVDEFIATKRNSDMKLIEQLRLIDAEKPHIDSIQVPWVFMSGLEFKNNPKNILKEILYRHDQDKKHPHSAKKFECRSEKIETKAIFKCDKVSIIKDHGPFIAHSIRNRPEVISSIDLCHKRMSRWFFKNLRNNDIENAYFICYHYRYISEENCVNKLKTNGWYINDDYSLEDMKTSTYPEIYDDTMLKKSLKYMQ